MSNGLDNAAASEPVIDFEPMLGFGGVILKSDIQPIEKLLGLAIATYITGIGELYMPSVETLARDTGLPVDKVTECLIYMSNTGKLPECVDDFRVW